MSSDETTAATVPLAASICSSFTLILRYMEDVRLGKSCGKDFAEFQTRLDTSKLRVTRLGVAIGVLVDPQMGQNRAFHTDYIKANNGRQFIESLSDDLMEIRKKSRMYAATKQSSLGSDIAAYNAAELEGPSQALHEGTNRILLRRTRGIPTGDREEWVVFERHRYNSMFEAISNFAREFEVLFPEARQTLVLLCAHETKELQQAAPGKTGLELLEKASQENEDVLLAQAVRDAIAARGMGHRYKGTDATENAKLTQGDYISGEFKGRVPLGRLGHDYSITTLRGDSKTRQGDTYGGENI